ncbi:hypothetical protein PVAND_008003 [Polypedilum vanderplanki]|uniref:DUF753 domain-containing protein n=1 Tax=Polypedilum vanderplanki TaxID=319348 RepID=A0A9J6C9K1_POLVA|nr:hypothetical protein PVAND_008003 [Polypedilum vanderplanki]
MLKSLAIIAIFGFVQINAQGDEFCVQCESSSTNFDCVLTENLDRFVTACPTNNRTGSCFTQITSEGFTRRGCGSQLNGAECVGELCNVCQLIAGSSSACNNILVLPQDRLTCHECSGEMDSTCGNLNGTDLRPIVCPIFRNDDRCYATRAGGRVRRGCESNAPSGLCNNNACTFCLGHGCNNFNGPELNSAFGIQIEKSLLLAIIAVFSLRFLNN